jgi:hypothetical protein
MEERKSYTPLTPAQVKLKIELEELGNERVQLHVEAKAEEEPEGLTDKMKRLTIEVEI